MKILILLLASIAFAQNPNTAAFPTTVAGDQTLGVAKRISSSTLSSTINASTLTVAVGSGTQFLQYEIITIDSEEMMVCSISVNTLTICTGARGFNGTTAASHTAGVAVRGTITSWYFNQINAEMKAVQTTLRDRIAQCQDAGINDAYACNPAPSIGAYAVGQVINFKANTANTGAATINLNAIGVKTIKKLAGGVTTDLDTNDIRAGQWVTLIYDGTNMQMLSQLGNTGSGTGVTVCIPASASSTAYTCNGSPTLGAYSTGLVVAFVPDVTNAGSSTVNINALGVKTINKITPSGYTALIAQDLVAAAAYLIEYDGTVFHLIGVAPRNQFILDETSALAQRSSINFTGTGVACADNAGAGRTDCTINTGSSGSIAGIADLKLTRTSVTVLDLAAGQAMCGTTPVSVSAVTITWFSGTTGTVWVGIDCANGGAITVARGSVDVTGAGFTEVADTDFDANYPNIKKIASVPVATSNFGTVVDYRTLVQGSDVVCGTGLACDKDANGNTRLSTDATPLTKATHQSGSVLRVASSTASDTYLATMSPTLTGYTDGMVIEFEATVTANTGAASINIDSLGVVNIKLCDGTTDPANSDIAIGRQVRMTYDATVFRLPCNPATVSGGSGAAVSRGVIASRPTCDSTISTYYATDGIGLFSHCNGTSWQDFYQGTPITRTTVAAASWNAVNSPTVADGNGFVVLSKATTGLGLALVTQADTAWTVTAGFLIPMAFTDGHECGIYATTGITAATHLASGLQIGTSAAGAKIYTRAYNPINGAIGNAGAALGPISLPMTGGVVWLRIGRSGATFTYYYGDGPDGKWNTLGSGDALLAGTPTHLGFGCDPRSSVPVSAKLIHWVVQ